MSIFQCWNEFLQNMKFKIHNHDHHLLVRWFKDYLICSGMIWLFGLTALFHSIFFFLVLLLLPLRLMQSCFNFSLNKSKSHSILTIIIIIIILVCGYTCSRCYVPCDGQLAPRSRLRSKSRTKQIQHGINVKMNQRTENKSEKRKTKPKNQKLVVFIHNHTHYYYYHYLLMADAGDAGCNSKYYCWKLPNGSIIFML